MRFVLLSCLCWLAACSSTPTPCIQYVECPDGDCAEQAHELCPKGYNTLRESDVGPDFGDFARQHFEGAKSGVQHLIVTCNP